MLCGANAKLGGDGLPCVTEDGLGRRHASRLCGSKHYAHFTIPPRAAQGAKSAPEMCIRDRDGVSRILGAWGPVMFFVVCGFNHSIADMMYCMLGLFAKPVYADLAVDFPHLTWGRYLAGNLLPVTLGNLLGGCAVAALFYSCYLRKPKAKKAKI